jgi:hypothetical protein
VPVSVLFQSFEMEIILMVSVNLGLQLPRVINSLLTKFVPAITDRMTISLHKDLECYQVNDVCQQIERGIELRMTCSFCTWVAAYSGLQ